MLLLLLLSASAGVYGTVELLSMTRWGDSAGGVKTSLLLHALRTPTPSLYIPSPVTPPPPTPT